MRDLRSPVFLHVDGGGILINLMFGLASVRLTGKTWKTEICPQNKTGGYGLLFQKYRWYVHCILY